MITLRMVHVIVVMTLLPLVVFRGRELRRYLAIDIATYVFAAIVWPHAGRLDPWLLAVAFVVAKVAIFSIFLNTAVRVKWSANRAAILALLVYTLLIPAMQRSPIDGDEPYYLLITESIVHDFDFDLANQYDELSRSATGRTDLVPQPGDPAGPAGERYSRHEPFLSFLLIPGYLIAGLGGAIATIVIFATLLVRSTTRLLEEEGVDDETSRRIFPFFAFGPPIVFYAARIWPEVPAAFFFVEALRGVRQRRAQRWVPAILFLSLLKLRFLLIAVPLVLRAVARSRRHILIAVVVIGMPLLIVWLITGSPTNVHSLRDLVAPSASGPLHGLFGLILDGAAGIAFQAPFYLLGILALVRWREMPVGFRLGMLSAVLYLAVLVPRSEWHGGWSPPLRYIVFLMPVLALGAASFRASARNLGGLVAMWTMALVIHGVTYPWRLFHIANGETTAGEYLSRLYRSDFSRLFPSFIRLNDAAIVISVLLVVALFVVALRREVTIPGTSLATLVIAAAFIAGQRPGERVDFEDAHVVHDGGELYPPFYTVARFAHRGGWILHQGHSLSFLSPGGPATLYYTTGMPSTLQIGSKVYEVPAGPGYRTLRVVVDSPGRIVLRVLRGSVNLDRLEHGS